MKKWLAMLMAACVAATVAWGQGAGEQEGGATLEQLADLMTKALGLTKALPSPATDQQKFAVLMQNGIAPAGGWKTGEPASLGDVVRVLALAMGLEDEVENPEDYQSWANVLEAHGISMADLMEGSRESVMDLEAVPTIVAQDYSVLSTDPLTSDPGALKDGFEQYSVGMEMQTRMHPGVPVPVPVIKQALAKKELGHKDHNPPKPTPH